MNLEVAEKDRAVLRRLAGKVAELADRPEERERAALWFRHNRPEVTRPLISCDPENGWHEIITDESYECVSEVGRSWEWQLRREIFWGERIKDDKVIEPYLNINYIYENSGWGVKETIHGAEDGGAYSWDAPVKDLDDLSALRIPEITVDEAASEGLLRQAEEILGDLITPRLKGYWWWTLGMTETLVKLRGLEQVMIDMIDNPAGLHRLMAILRDGFMAKVDFLEENGYFSLNNRGDYVGSGGFGWTDELPAVGFDEKKVRAADIWNLFESQETVSISPGMFEEFVYQYQLPLMERFGLICYGCCEPLDKRWHVVKNIPGLRRVSVSPWADVSVMADNLEDKYVFSWKPTPTLIAGPTFDEDRIREATRDALERTKGCCLEIMMKDTHTIGNDQRRPGRWVEIVREEIDKVY